MLPLRALPIFILLLSTIAITGCQHIGTDESKSLFIGRYTQYMRGNMPEQYADLNNDLPASLINISEGKRLYQNQCYACHGEFGKGDGLSGEQLNPRPANLGFTRRLPLDTDTFFFWTISEGGKAIGTAMPEFGTKLSAEEIWQIVHYINTDLTLDQGT